MYINAEKLGFQELNDMVRSADGKIEIEGCNGQRFIADGAGKGKTIIIRGTPGNALGAYLNGADIEVCGNAQDAVGDTMDSGSIVIHGSAGDTVGYAMRGGEIYVKGSVGYRAGIHIKQYGDKVPHLVIGGCAGSFLGEYQAGGVIVVFGIDGGSADGTEKKAVGDFPCTGIHGGVVYLKGDGEGIDFPPQANVAPADESDMAVIKECAEKYCRYFGGEPEKLLDGPYTAIRPNSKNPYRQMYVAN